MKHVICTIVLAVSAISAGVNAEIPRGPDAVNGAFVRMLGHEATSVSDQPLLADHSNRMFETWINRTARNEVSSLEAGFAHMLARRDEVPVRSILRGQPDPVLSAIVGAVESQRVNAQKLALRD